MDDDDTPWMYTYSGAKFYPLSPHLSDVRLDDIIHALSNICRFGGHCKEPYSVAQHSVVVANGVPARHRRHALLHDAAEAYIGDCVMPIKGAVRIGARSFGDVEDDILAAIYAALGLCRPNAHAIASVKRADWRAVVTEKRDVLLHTDLPWNMVPKGITPFGEIIKPVSPPEARKMWRSAWVECLLKTS